MGEREEGKGREKEGEPAEELSQGRKGDRDGIRKEFGRKNGIKGRKEKKGKLGSRW